MDKVVAIIPAAGQGSRMGASVSKVYIDVLGRPLLAYTLDKFQRHSLIADIIILTRESEQEYCQKEIVEKYGFSKVKKIVVGGAERQDSVSLGLAALEDDASLVLIHDGARPLISEDIISRSIEAALTKGAVAVGMPVKDTIKVVDEQGIVQSTPERQTLWAVQTPQVFQRDIIDKAYQQATLHNRVATDDASLVEQAGGQVVMIQGSYENIKVTTPEDLVYFSTAIIDS